MYERLVLYKNLNSRTAAKDSQRLVRTCQVLDQSLHVLPLLALQVLDQFSLASPGESWRYVYKGLYQGL